MSRNDYMLDFISNQKIMDRVIEAKNYFWNFRSFWARQYPKQIDFTEIDQYFTFYEERARGTHDRMCDDCIFTLTNDPSVNNPYREARRKRHDEGYEKNGIKHQFAKDSNIDPGPHNLCLECENRWLDELQHAWELYWQKRVTSIEMGVPKDEQIEGSKCRRLPDGKFMLEKCETPGYTEDELRKIKYLSQHIHSYQSDIVKKHTNKDFVSIMKEFQNKLDKRYVRKETSRYEIKIVLDDNIAEDGLRLKKWEAGERDRSIIVRSEIKNIFINITKKFYGKDVLDEISAEDINEYCGMVERGGDMDYLRHLLFSKYNIDQNTDSCVYFIRQGEAVKIGITGDLKKRFSQIKTSASLPCKIENAVYTHHGQDVERRLHKAFKEYKSHLEWFNLPAEIEEALFRCKSIRDINRVLIDYGDEEQLGLFS